MNSKLLSLMRDWSLVTAKIDERAFHNAKLLLKIYKDVVWRVEERIFDFDAECYATSGKHLGELIDCLIDADTLIDKQQFEDKLRSIHASQAIIEVVDKALAMLKSYPYQGTTYYDILYYQYITRDRSYKEQAMLDKLHMERSSYYRKKKEAINLFGVILWGYMLPSMKQIVLVEFQSD